MTRSKRAWRVGLALTYAALTVWMQAGDLHGHAEAAVVHCDPACNETREHYAGHPAPTLDPSGNDCLACQGRTCLAALERQETTLGGCAVETVEMVEPGSPPSRRLGPPSARGPPSA